MSEELQQIPDGEVRRALCVVAHPDDVEYGLSAVVNHWVKAGAEVAYLLLTAGEAGMQRPPEEVGPLRAEEQRAACEVVGVEDLEILDHPDGTLVYSLELRRDVARKIRQFRPDTLVTNHWGIDVSWGLNHADHRVTGLVTADAMRDADNRWLFTELLDEGLEPWHVSKLLVYGSSAPTHAVLLDEDDVRAGVRSLEAHVEYLKDLPDHPAPADFIPPMLEDQGKAAGSDFAMVFQVFG